MNYLSLAFAILVAFALLLYYIVPQKMRGAVLLVSSLVFYASFDLRYLLFLLFTALSTFLTAKCLHRFSRKVLAVGICVASNVAVWFYIKSLPWSLKTLWRLLVLMGVKGDAPQIPLIIPIGISYFTLQAIAYLIDVSKGKIKAEDSFWKYLLFLSWFPAIVQGPISRYEQLMPQLLNKNKLSYDKMRQSLLLVLFGVIKKMVIADRLSIFVSHCFNYPADIKGLVLYLAAIGYAVQLYMDFSGCVDICRGVSGLFGVDMVNNFNRPYFATSIKDFWNRWHISFSSWLKDYIYIPLGGNRKGTVRKYVNIIITFLISGLWHGAGLVFLAWGLLHGLYQTFGAITAPLRRKIKALLEIKEGSVSERIYQRIITFNLVTFAWIFFRAPSFKSALVYIGQMFKTFNVWTLFDGEALFGCGLSQNAMILVLINLLAVFAVELFSKRAEDSANGLLNLHFILRWSVYVLLILDVLFFGVYGSGYDVSNFLYGGF